MDGLEAAPPEIFAVTGTATRDRSELDLSIDDDSTMRERDQCQEEQIGHKRSPAGSAVQQPSGKRRKANQPMKRATRQVGRDHAAGDHACTANNETQMETAAASVARLPEHEPPTVVVRASKDAQMVDRALQTEAPSRLQADLLHMSAVLKLDARLLQETKRWKSTDDLNQGLFKLSAQFVRGLYDICGST
ncbi:hypothetical protein N0V82_005962 [Gnomoniopsis sp. IMI 355080]|nr:hypothetical protein N0V82_005962 [Gnomoniopsis sp. IMI 355080]